MYLKGVALKLIIHEDEFFARDSSTYKCHTNLQVSVKLLKLPV